MTLPPDTAVFERAAERQRQAGELLAKLRLVERWSEFGVPRIVGSVAFGLMVARDIDMEIYCPRPRVEMGFEVVTDVARRPEVWKVRFSNELEGPDAGLYWQLRYRASDSEIWKIDMWLLAHDHPGPRSWDLVKAMNEALSEESRVVILAIKEAMQGRGDVHSIDVYRAVLEDGVRSPGDFLAWHAEHASAGLTSWRPSASQAR